MKRGTAVVWCMAAVGLLGACGGPSEEPLANGGMVTARSQALVSPPASLSGGFMNYLGTLTVGGAVSSNTGTTAAYEGFKLTVAAHTQVALEVTHLGTGVGVDTGLFVYGPKDANGSYGTRILFQDDDSGYGELSKIPLATLDTAGEYLVVVGWSNGLGKQYRLQASCVGGACVANPTPAPAGTPVKLAAFPLEPGLQALLDTGNAYREDMFSFLDRYDFAWPYSTPATLDAAAAAVLARSEYSGYRNKVPTTSTYAAFQSQMYLQFQGLHPAIPATYGEDPANAQVRSYFREFSTGPNGDNWRTLNIILLPVSRHVLVYEQTAHEI
ncbi:MULTISPECIES: hypothetical protein [unclassified Corallococcus]|uniref:hypothetical protein n=1 Tax=unclassified Corallococcus TaxID=2685029 RepID=UPI001A8E238E|nr:MULTISPECIES: hypothetical protein [unclassified Corallococcus]MBN9686530.1 hypothetical protein [Corallococcus sp. NCSPR001]WAS82044.1 hypothetical protein O0N60_22255 [Corallococcus sp. NCRR]